jgi:hypothetical protein
MSQASGAQLVKAQFASVLLGSLILVRLSHVDCANAQASAPAKDPASLHNARTPGIAPDRI